MIRYKLITEESESNIPFEYMLLPKYLFNNEVIYNCAISVDDAYDKLVKLGKELCSIEKPESFEFKNVFPIYEGNSMSTELYKQLNTYFKGYDIDHSTILLEPLNPNYIMTTSLDITDEKITQLLKKWINENGYPTPRKFSLDFVNECKYLYLFDDCIKWMYKANDEDVNKSLQPYINFFKNIELFNFDIKNYENTSLYFLIMNEYGFDISLSDKEIEIFHTNDLKHQTDIVEVLRKLILIAIHQITKSGLKFPNDYSVLKDKPFYNNETDTYSVVDVANSLIGIAFYRLNQNATTYYLGKRKRVCANPHCNNVFEISKGNYKYCSICRNKDIPNILRVKKFTEKQKR